MYHLKFLGYITLFATLALASPESEPESNHNHHDKIVKAEVMELGIDSKSFSRSPLEISGYPMESNKDIQGLPKNDNLDRLVLDSSPTMRVAAILDPDYSMNIPGTLGPDEMDHETYHDKKIPPGMLDSRSKFDDVKYVEEEDENLKDVVLKHYGLFESDSHAFYPAWSYSGFFSPIDWDKVNIQYFTHSDPNFITSPDEVPLWKHKSAMELCTEAVFSVIQTVKEPYASAMEQCWESTQNECTNHIPSPIDILTKEAKEDHNLAPLIFSDYDHQYHFQMFLPEDGTDLLTLRLIPREDEALPGIMKEDGMLYLDRILFRVGFDKDSGSEHMIDGRSAGMELQFYFAPKNLTYWEALSQYRFMADNDPHKGQNVHAFSVFVNVTDEDVADPSEANVEYTKIFEGLSQGAEKLWLSRNPKRLRAIRFIKSMISLENLLRVPLIGTRYIYEGSMTHPPCLQSVIWTVFETPLWITYSQWKTFVFIHSEYSDDKFLGGNIRPMDYISVKVNAETYMEMKKATDEGDIEQFEIDRAIKLRNRNRVKPNEVILFRTFYEKYKKYYARRVFKSHGGGKKKNADFNYEELTDEISNAHFNKYSKYTLIFLTVIFIIY